MKEQSPIENQESKEITRPMAEKLFSDEMRILKEILPAIEQESDLIKKQEMAERLEAAVFSSLIALSTVSESLNQGVEKSAEQILEKING